MECGSNKYIILDGIAILEFFIQISAHKTLSTFRIVFIDDSHLKIA